MSENESGRDDRADEDRVRIGYDSTIGRTTRLIHGSRLVRTQPYLGW